MRYAAGTANCINAIRVSQLIECESTRLIPFLQPYLHQSRDRQTAVPVIIRNIRFRDLAYNEIHFFLWD